MKKNNFTFSCQIKPTDGEWYQYKNKPKLWLQIKHKPRWLPKKIWGWLLGKILYTDMQVKIPLGYVGDCEVKK